jgi:hypothetical protein
MAAFLVRVGNVSVSELADTKHNWKQINFACSDQYKTSRWIKGGNSVVWDESFVFHFDDCDESVNFKIGLLGRSMLGKPDLLGTCMHTVSSDAIKFHIVEESVTKMLTMEQLYRVGDISFTIKFIGINKNKSQSVDDFTIDGVQTLCDDVDVDVEDTVEENDFFIRHMTVAPLYSDVFSIEGQKTDGENPVPKNFVLKRPNNSNAHEISISGKGGGLQIYDSNVFPETNFQMDENPDPFKSTNKTSVIENENNCSRMKRAQTAEVFYGQAFPEDDEKESFQICDENPDPSRSVNVGISRQKAYGDLIFYPQSQDPSYNIAYTIQSPTHKYDAKSLDRFVEADGSDYADSSDGKAFDQNSSIYKSFHKKNILVARKDRTILSSSVSSTDDNISHFEMRNNFLRAFHHSDALQVRRSVAVVTPPAEVDERTVDHDSQRNDLLSVFRRSSLVVPKRRPSSQAEESSQPKFSRSDYDCVDMEDEGRDCNVINSDVNNSDVINSIWMDVDDLTDENICMDDELLPNFNPCPDVNRLRLESHLPNGEIRYNDKFKGLSSVTARNEGAQSPYKANDSTSSFFHSSSDLKLNQLYVMISPEHGYCLITSRTSDDKKVLICMSHHSDVNTMVASITKTTLITSLVMDKESGSIKLNPGSEHAQECVVYHVILSDQVFYEVKFDEYYFEMINGEAIDLINRTHTETLSSNYVAGRSSDLPPVEVEILESDITLPRIRHASLFNDGAIVDDLNCHETTNEDVSGGEIIEQILVERLPRMNPDTATAVILELDTDYEINLLQLKLSRSAIDGSKVTPVFDHKDEVVEPCNEGRDPSEPNSSQNCITS